MKIKEKRRKEEITKETKNITDIIITSKTEEFSASISAGDQLFCLWVSCQMRSLIPCVPSNGGAGRLLFFYHRFAGRN